MNDEINRWNDYFGLSVESEYQTEYIPPESFFERQVADIWCELLKFDKVSLKDNFLNAGYRRDHKTLFIWEGVIYYLFPESVDDILYFIKSNTLTGSTLSFDFIISSPDILDLYGIREVIEYMRTNYAGEPVRFNIEKGKIESFLAVRGYKMIEHMTPEDMERKYLSLKSGAIAGRVMGHFHLVSASV